MEAESSRLTTMSCAAAHAGLLCEVTTTNDQRPRPARTHQHHTVPRAPPRPVPYRTPLPRLRHLRPQPAPQRLSLIHRSGRHPPRVSPCFPPVPPPPPAACPAAPPPPPPAQRAPPPAPRGGQRRRRWPLRRPRQPGGQQPHSGFACGVLARCWWCGRLGRLSLPAHVHLLGLPCLLP